MQAKRLNHVAPPRAAEIELRVIAALTYIGDYANLRVQQAMLQLDFHCFQNMDYRAMFEIISELFHKKQSFDLVTFMTLVPNEIYTLACEMLKDAYVNISYLEHDVEVLLCYRTLRKQLKILVDSVNLSLDAVSPQESLLVISEELQKINQTGSTTRNSYLRSYETIADEFLNEELEDDSEIHVDIPGLPPVPNRALITIAGRSGHGKTFFALYLMDKIIDCFPAKQTIYFNLEMDERVMMERHAKLIGVQGGSRKEVIKSGLAKLMTKNVSLVSEPMITIEEIETECHLAAMRQPIAVIVVDYLGLIKTKSRSERKDLDQSDIAKRLAALALKLNCVVILLSQVNRDFKNRPIGDRCPMPHDAAESMGSVHSSSWWIGIDQPQTDTSDPEWQDMFLIANRKNRGGSLFDLRLRFKGGTFGKWQRPFCGTYSSQKLETLEGF